MKVRVPHYYDSFKCSGSACPDTCCVGWMIEIDDASYERFMKLDGHMGEVIRANIIEREDGRFFSLNQDGRCVFLNKDNLCEMVIKLGEDSLCSLCDNYPRVGEEYGNLREMGLSLSCPEVSRLVFSSDKPIAFGEWYQDEEEAQVDYSADPVFIKLTDIRDVLFGIAQNRNISIAHRLSLYIMMAARIQNILDEEGPVAEIISKLECIERDFSDDEYIERSLKSIRTQDYACIKSYVKNAAAFIDGLEIINEKWMVLSGVLVRLLKESDEDYERLCGEFASYYEENTYVYEHLMVYYVYRYFLKMIFDGDIYSKAVMCAYTYMIIRNTDIALWWSNGKKFDLGDRIRVMYLYSKEIEHCESNISRLYDEFWDNDMYQPSGIIPVLC